MFFEILHGKSLSYGVGGHVKTALKCALHFGSAWVFWGKCIGWRWKKGNEVYKILSR